MDLEKYGVETHKKVLEFWKNNSIYSKSRIIFQKSNNKKPFYFLQGPPYTSGKFHIAHAWNNSMKDFIMRYKRMKGFEVWDRAGYDMHGLPTAKKVQAKFNLKTKEDIAEFGYEKFAEECIKLSKEYADLMSEELFDMGIWMDYENPYLPITQEYIDGVWYLIKKAHEKNRLYKGLRTTSWCRDCATALAKHEQEYVELTDTSIYVKFQTVEDKNTFFVIWTTTPWTITFNLAIMVNPDFDYSYVEVHNKIKKETWIIATELVDSVMKHIELDYKIIKSVKGKELTGKKYIHVWQDEIKDLQDIKDKYDKAFTILESKEYVTLGTGSGLVHTAPGCGPEDYEVGYRNGLPAFNTITEYGVFPEGYGRFTGMTAKVDDKKFIKAMEDDKVIIAKQDFVHDYATCERCHTPVIFRTTEQWFFKVEDLKPKMLEFNQEINWIPKTGGNAFEAWLENLRDNSITKQRFWGTPVPIWVCDKCGEVEVIGSRAELEKKQKVLPENLHKPWIDTITWKCSECGGEMKRIPDILDVWIDAGTASWNCLHYPTTKEHFEKFFPADFILEAREQIRGWFNLLMVASILALDKNSFKSCYMHGMLTDVDGVKMSKSLGNIMRPEELTEKYGSDTLRFYMSRTKAGNDINFSWDEADLAYKNLMILWNVHNLIINFSKEIAKTPELIKDTKDLEKPELFILSRLNRTLKKVTEYYDSFQIDMLSSEIEKMFLELSRVYIQIVRADMTFADDKRKKIILDTMFTVLDGIIKMLAPITPFISEAIYQNLKNINAVSKESIHLEYWTETNEKFIDENLESEFLMSLSIIEAGLSARDKSQTGLRWPLPELMIALHDSKNKTSINKVENMILNQLNVKTITFGHPEFNIEVKPNYKKIGQDFGTETGDVLVAIKGKNEEIAQTFKENKDYKFTVKDKEIVLTQEMFEIKKLCEGYAVSEFKFGTVYLKQEMTPELEIEGFTREITRRIQNLRKIVGLNKSDRIKLVLTLPEELTDVKKYESTLLVKVGADKVSYASSENCKHSAIETIKSKKIGIGFDL